MTSMKVFCVNDSETSPSRTDTGTFPFFQNQLFHHPNWACSFVPQAASPFPSAMAAPQANAGRARQAGELAMAGGVKPLSFK
jgi:hypothetical protein